MKTPAEMRVEVAKDVLKQLRAGRFSAYSGAYVRVVNSIDYDQSDLREAINSDDKDVQNYTKRIVRCNVCAKGALLISTIDRYDRVTVGQLYEAAAKQGNSSDVRAIPHIALNVDASEAISWLFPIEQLHEMERAFEAYEDGKGKGDLSHDYRIVEDAFPDDHLRLVAIMENVIANNGEFVPQLFLDLCEQQAGVGVGR